MKLKANLPEANLIQAAKAAGGFNTFLGMAQRAGLTSILEGAGPYTIFAPTDEAFAKIPRSARDKLMPGSQVELLKAIVSGHLVSGRMLSQRLQGRRIRGKSVQGGELLIDGGEAISVNGAQVVRPDIVAENGVLHGIDKVLWPKGAQLELA